MAQASFHFPRGFLWGTATASHQVEGNNTNNNWWAWEQEPGHIINGHKSGLACDWWGGRWREDFDRASQGGQNAHRLSIEWSRIQPVPDRWDETALDYYREMLRGLLERGMTPMVTLHHFSDPIWFSRQGGWESDQAVERFETYTHKVVEALREYVSLWVTINEPNVLVAFGYVLGLFPPGRKDLGAAFRVSTALLKAHAAAYTTIHALQPHARVGIATHYRGFQPAKAWFPLDRLVASLQASAFNIAFPRALSTGVLQLPYARRAIPSVRSSQDFLGINYYTRSQVRFNLLKPDQLFGERGFSPGLALSDTGFIANDPPGMFEALKWGRQFKLPMIVTENGIEDADDDLRPRYLTQHIHQVWRAVNFNWPIKGYFHWTLVDNFEWERGWTQRFGLWDLEVATQTRRKRPSADLYAAICRENGITSEMVASFVPSLVEEMFPG